MPPTPPATCPSPLAAIRVLECRVSVNSVDRNWTVGAAVPLVQGTHDAAPAEEPLVVLSPSIVPQSYDIFDNFDDLECLDGVDLLVMDCMPDNTYLFDDQFDYEL
ncbi:Aste57867_5702 [Aphanomyces stellatus]|nr:hypothetical protein As57867_005689 [Aphanomyces stellatus]VFT82742.1 Aste57867_5702 [Aphanomyces stellatus]